MHIVIPLQILQLLCLTSLCGNNRILLKMVHNLRLTQIAVVYIPYLTAPFKVEKGTEMVRVLDPASVSQRLSHVSVAADYYKHLLVFGQMVSLFPFFE